MKSNLPRYAAAAVIVLLLAAGVCDVSAQQRDGTDNSAASTDVGISITGSMDHPLLNRITRNLQEAAAKLPPDEAGKAGFAAGLRNPPPEIIMGQFRETALDIPYANTNNPFQRLDIVYPFVGEAPYKVIVNFHGGGWEAGSKRSADNAPVQWAACQGYAVVNAGYRLSGEAKWPAQIHDAKAAIRFIRANAKKYRLDADKIVVWGASAGGHLAEMLGATNNNPKFEDLSMGNPQTSSAVQGVVAWYGIADITSLARPGVPYADKLMGYCIKCKEEKARVASPIEFVNKHFPPALFVHGTGDQVVPFGQAIEMAKKVNTATGKEQARVKLFINGSHGDAAIKTVENVADNLYFVDGILFPGGRNPYRSLHYRPLKLTR